MRRWDWEVGGIIFAVMLVGGLVYAGVMGVLKLLEIVGLS